MSNNEFVDDRPLETVDLDQSDYYREIRGWLYKLVWREEFQQLQWELVRKNVHESVDEWDPSQGTNPDTCLHMLAVFVDPVLDVWICASCDATLSEEWMRQFVWTWDKKHDIFKRASIRDSRRVLRAGSRSDGIVVASTGD